MVFCSVLSVVQSDINTMSTIPVLVSAMTQPLLTFRLITINLMVLIRLVIKLVHQVHLGTKLQVHVLKIVQPTIVQLKTDISHTIHSAMNLVRAVQLPSYPKEPV